MWTRVDGTGTGYRCPVVGLRSPSHALPEAPPAPATHAEAPARPLKILFVVERGALLRFALLLPALAERGHEVHIAFEAGKAWRRTGVAQYAPPPLRTLQLAEELCSAHPGLRYGLLPKRGEADGWGDVAWLVRGLADLAHNAHPRYASAPALRRRAHKSIMEPLETPGEFEPISQRLALRVANRLVGDTDERRSKRVLRWTSRLEAVIPASPELDTYLVRLQPDLVLATGTIRYVSPEVDVLKSAQRLGIPTGIFVTSWDNLTNKGSLKFTPDRVFVWNDVQARDAVELHDIPADRVRSTGAHVFDEWFERRPSRSRSEFLAEVGLDPAEPYVVYLCSSRNIVRPSEVEFVRDWVAALRASDDERLRRMGVLVRPHPNADEQWRGVELGAENAVVWPRQGIHPVQAQARADFVDTLAHSAAVVGINTTAMIEAAILGKSVLTILVEKFKQETTLHFHYLLAENGGFLHVAADLVEHTRQLGDVLDEDEEGAARRRGFVEAFVRPGGLDRSAAPLGAAAIEELGDVRADRRRPIGSYLLRPPVSGAALLARAHRRRRIRRQARPNKL
jgi:hypothetical protein